MSSITSLKTLVPEHLTEEAEQSGFFQCPTCGLIWFGRPEIAQCPEGPHGRPVHVVLCRTCDDTVPIERFAAHLANRDHEFGIQRASK
jgi:hypothetical protein